MIDVARSLMLSIFSKHCMSTTFTYSSSLTNKPTSVNINFSFRNIATSSSTSRLPHLQSVRSHPYATSSYKQKFLFRSKNVAREASKLQMHFVKVLGHTQRCFMEKESKDKDFRTEFSILLINLPISKRFKHLAFLEAKAKNIMAAESVSDIFIILRNHWNYTDYSLLDHLIDVFGNATMKEIMKKYKSDLEDFEKRTTVLQFQEARGNTKEPYINFGKVVAQLNVEPSQCTLWKVRCFIEHMKMEGSLEDYVGLILEIGAGSVLVTLALPQDGTLLVENLITVQFWATNFAESVTIDGEEILMVYAVARNSLLIMIIALGILLYCHY